MKVTIVGAAKSGSAAAKLAVSLGYKVKLTESKNVDKFEKEYDNLKKLGVDCEFGLNSFKFLENCDLVITSPGVPPHSKFLHEAQKRGIEIISELEFAWRHSKNRAIAVTGTNGKTTTTALIEFILKNGGIKAIACGNIGTPLSELVYDADENTVFVIETSSYQLDRVKTFSPDVAVILNITPDHLTYHGSMDNYVESKWKITSSQSENNLLILNVDDETISQMNLKTCAKIAHLSQNPVGWGIYTKGDEIIFKTADKEEVLMLTGELSLPGIHNRYNSMAAALAARVFEIKNEDIRDSLMKFSGVEHRLEFVRTLNGIDFINDSKATNINATWYALSSYKQPIVWIAGGRGDNNNYAELDQVVEKNVSFIIAIGEEAQNIFNHFCTKKRCLIADDLRSAIAIAYENAEFGEKVLFTPACKSFDMFDNFEHRGEVFKEIVNSL